MVTVSSIRARQVFDSRGYPTVEAEVNLSGGGHGRFITPSGASVGKKEALELRDNDKTNFLGKGVNKAIANIRGDIAQAIVGKSFASIEALDNCLIELDGTLNKSHLGANAILSVSGAFFRALSDKSGQPLYEALDHQGPYLLPIPLVNVINGGAHANNGIDIQEFMLVPVGALNFSGAMRMVAETFYALKMILQTSGFSTAVGDEGGFAPALKSNEHALDLLEQAVSKAGFNLGRDIAFALDVAANELYDESQKTYRMNGDTFDREQLLLWYESLTKRYPICSIEDPFAEDDTAGFALMTKKIGSNVQVVGDDLFVTNEQYIRMGIENRYANAVLIKINQIGTISEAISATKLTKSAGLGAIISHRSGDTEDTTIADLAVRTGAGQIKTGSMSRSERVAKYNRLLRIEEELGSRAQFSVPPLLIGGR
jgi:enolase